MDLTVKMDCGKGTENEYACLLLHILDIGVLNSSKEFNLEIMPELQQYDFKVERTILQKVKKEEGLYDVWQANIAMAFKDEYHRFKKKKGKHLNSQDIHNIANDSAKHFLDLLLGSMDETSHNI